LNNKSGYVKEISRDSLLRILAKVWKKKTGKSRLVIPLEGLEDMTVCRIVIYTKNNSVYAKIVESGEKG